MTDYAAGKPWKMEKQQHILEAAYKLFSENGIVPVTMPDIAKASGVGRATVFRYFSSKLELVIAIGTWKWEEYIESRGNALPRETIQRMNGAEYLRFYLDAFLDLYRNHADILRFNYIFNSYLRYEAGAVEQRQPYLRITDGLGATFHQLYERGKADGTLNTEYSEQTMFSSTFHIIQKTLKLFSRNTNRHADVTRISSAGIG
jgi:AcrR family transcriptional regulator